MTALKEFRVKLTVRNNLLVSRREALGISAPELAEKLGVCYSMIWKLETLRELPLLEDGSWSKAARKLAEFYRVLPEDLFPEAILAAKHVSAEREMGAEEAFALSGGGEAQLPDAQLFIEERKRLVGALAYDGLVFVNPPYGRGELAKWMDKCAAEAGRLHLTDIEVIALVPASTGSRWFHEALGTAQALHLWGPGRISFGNGPPGNGGAPSIDSALIYWGDRPHRFLDAMSGAGHGVLL